MARSSNVIVDIHVIQTVPPSCVNRDDTGSPKTCIYGGTRRSRVSSQSWKRAVRLAFRDMYASEKLANRTKNIVSMVENEILVLDPSVDAKKLAIEALEAAGLKINAKAAEKGTDALFFMSVSQAKALADIAVNNPAGLKDKESCKRALKDQPSIDMALFGRMVASDPSLNYDAAAMVAHSISTHKVQTEYDYFTAVDDLSSEDSTGAGHLGTVEFNSSTLYRYASVNVSELFSNLGDDTPIAVRNFTEAFLLSMPTGKMTSFANRTIPNSVYITLRNDQAVNMAAAFEKNIKMDEDGGFVNASTTALASYANSVYSDFVSEPVKQWTIGSGLDILAPKMKLDQVLETLEKTLQEMLSEVE